MSKQDPTGTDPKSLKESESDVSEDLATNVPTDDALLESHQEAFRAADEPSEEEEPTQE